MSRQGVAIASGQSLWGRGSVRVLWLSCVTVCIDE